MLHKLIASHDRRIHSTQPPAVSRDYGFPMGLLPQTRLYFDRDRVQQWLEQESNPVLLEIKLGLIRSRQYVPFETFFQNLHEAVRQMNPTLEDRPCVALWDNDAHKSRRWAFELAWPVLKKKPAHGFYLNLIQVDGDYLPGKPFDLMYEAVFRQGIHDFILIDDAAYSARQITATMMAVKAFFDFLQEKEPRFNEQPVFHIAVPYITTKAIQLITATDPTVKLFYQQHMPTIREILPDKHLAYLHASLSHPGGDFLSTDLDLVVTYFDHKIADGDSFYAPLKSLIPNAHDIKPYTHRSIYYIMENFAVQEYYNVLGEKFP